MSDVFFFQLGSLVSGNSVLIMAIVCSPSCEVIEADGASDVIGSLGLKMVGL
jgi:hypothetical protein